MRNVADDELSPVMMSAGYDDKDDGDRRCAAGKHLTLQFTYASSSLDLTVYPRLWRFTDRSDALHKMLRYIARDSEYTVPVGSRSIDKG